jgi:ferredoxin/flavodoxin---NADP+ reductase
VTRVYDKTAAREGFEFFGGVELGGHIRREDLLERYHVLIYAVGMSEDRRLGIPGEEAPGCHPATQFVAWYNAHPEYAGHEFDLSGDTAVVIGNGNVALDVARMLVLSPSELAITDTADHAVQLLSNSSIRRVVVLGRRGPAQAAFTNPELRELGELSRADVIVDPADIELDGASAAWLASDAADATARRNIEVLRAYAARQPRGQTHRVELRFLRSPVEVLTDERGRTRGVRVVKNELVADSSGRLQARPTDEREEIECSLVLRSIGYRGKPIAGVPFDERHGLVPNQGGRVTDEDGNPLAGEYAVGWIKRGPVGVIGTNKKDAADTVARIREDLESGALNRPSLSADREAIWEWLARCAPDAVRWDGWLRIDEHERSIGKPQGRPRVKLVALSEMLSIVSGSGVLSR